MKIQLKGGHFNIAAEVERESRQVLDPLAKTSGQRSKSGRNAGTNALLRKVITSKKTALKPKMSTSNVANYASNYQHATLRVSHVKK